MRIRIMLLTLSMLAVAAGCEKKSDFEKKSEADAAVQRVHNLREDAATSPRQLP